MNIKMKTFWENTHKRETVSLLSGCKYDETIDFLQVSSLIKPRGYVLEVGVGLGHVTRGLYAAGATVCGLDISGLALNRVKQYCERVFTVEEIAELPTDYFDVVICHNVIQHIPTDLLIEELEHIIRSLKTNGIFAMEFVSGDDVGDSWSPEYVYSKGLPTFTRSPEFMVSLVTSVGGECFEVVNNECNIGKVKGCHVFHTRRKRYDS